MRGRRGCADRTKLNIADDNLRIFVQTILNRITEKLFPDNKARMRCRSCQKSETVKLKIIHREVPNTMSIELGDGWALVDDVPLCPVCVRRNRERAFTIISFEQIVEA